MSLNKIIKLESDFVIDRNQLIELADNSLNSTNSTLIHLNFILNDKAIAKQYKQICKALLTKEEYDNIQVQQGGSSLLLFSSFAAATVCSGISAALFWWHTRKVCKSKYPILKENEAPSAAHIILKVCPSSWETSLKKTGVKKFLLRLHKKFHGMLGVLSVLNTDTTSKKIVVNVLHVIVDAVADVATLGAGGDMLINMLFAIKNIIELCILVTDNLIKIMLQRNGLRFLYDIFRIDFSGGPFGVKCWVNYILEQYGENSHAYQLSCKFFNLLLDKLAEFMGNLLGSMIPDTIGLLSIIIPLIVDNFRKGSLTFLEEKLNYYYNKISWSNRASLENPLKLKKLLDKLLDEGSSYLHSFGQSFVNLLKSHTAYFAICIHKFLAILFTLLQLFISCN